MAPSHMTRFALSLLPLLTPLLALAVEIDEVSLHGRPHLRIQTARATWFYDRAGGGFSSLRDAQGQDWIGFSPTPLNQYPASAAAGYRGLPNLLHGKSNPEAGAGHPGFDRCSSEVVGPALIRTTTTSGVWCWTWEFSERSAVFTMERASPDHPWWFLYEGTIAGRYAPFTHYWGSDASGFSRETPDHNARQAFRGVWRWAYFGDDDSPWVLVLAQLGNDTATSVFSYMGSDAAGLRAKDGMTVFGFGRDGLVPLLWGSGRRFCVGFVPTPSRSAEHPHQAIARAIASCLPETR